MKADEIQFESLEQIEGIAKELKPQTSPFDPRFPHQNQAK